MKALLVTAAVLGMTEFAAAGVKLTTADVLERRISKRLSACTAEAVKSSERLGGLVVPGLKSCYSNAEQLWERETTPLLQMLTEFKESACTPAVQALVSEWEQYYERLVQLPAVQDMAINTDDELRLVLRKHLYELAWKMAQLVDCPKARLP